jgi:uncharacterized protein YbbC (DUF1343 family)
MKFVKNLAKFSGCNAGILTNQSAFGYQKSYHFEIYSEFVKLKKVFLPEHGLFAELQDQVSGSNLEYIFGESEIVNLYGDTEESLIPNHDILKELDIVIIDIRDVGSRYYTFLTTAFYILDAISKMDKAEAPIFVIVDSPNPIGGKIEGSPLHPQYESFVGIRTAVHRHGLTPAGLLCYYKETFKLKVEIAIIPVGVYHSSKFDSFHWIPPSPNIPTQNTCFVYPGQCLLEGTNLSEGRGTTKPFEIFGAPYLKGKAKEELDRRLKKHQSNSLTTRNLRFLPTFHKFRNEICEGYQLMIDKPKKFHSLFFTLYLIRNIKELFPEDFAFLEGVYEFRSDRPAIELLVGDPILLDYLEGKSTDRAILEYLENTEQAWFLRTKEFRY